MAVPRVKGEGAEVPLARKLFSKWYLFAENPSSEMERPDLPRVPDANLYVFNWNPGGVIREMNAFLPDCLEFPKPRVYRTIGAASNGG
jgi:hypothetical protein